MEYDNADPSCVGETSFAFGSRLNEDLVIKIFVYAVSSVVKVSHLPMFEFHFPEFLQQACPTHRDEAFTPTNTCPFFAKS